MDYCVLTRMDGFLLHRVKLFQTLFNYCVDRPLNSPIPTNRAQCKNMRIWRPISSRPLRDIHPLLHPLAEIIGTSRLDFPGGKQGEGRGEGVGGSGSGEVAR